MTLNEAKNDSPTPDAAEGEWDLVANLEATTLDEGGTKNEPSNLATPKRKACFQRQLLRQSRRSLRGQLQALNVELKQALAETEQGDGPTPKVRELRQSRRLLRVQLQAVNRQLQQARQGKKEQDDTKDVVNKPAAQLVALRKSRRGMKRNWMVSKRRLAKEWQHKRRATLKGLREQKRAFLQERKHFFQERRALKEAWLSQEQAVNNEIQAIKN